ncbi:UNKNOWN [Stylonychia lemnae]|uniref:Uncharacterized protein n=1 Tax=Stylonychia lemnae TaxID=5949 RepID=A0A077ZTU1_STYLE|nr:UNKNOWN [Stylonychia lemnae]|eukprot:CDW73308.1 UNKNOWN [Stylonychia lemnae]
MVKHFSEKGQKNALKNEMGFNDDNKLPRDDMDRGKYQMRYETKESFASRQKDGKIQSFEPGTPQEGSEVVEVWNTPEYIKIYAETDTTLDTFKQNLKEFCHYYQIPFQENNIPKTCTNSAKILYRMLDDKKRPNQKFNEIVQYLKSIPKTEIDETFNPFRLKEKWMKFFRSGYQRVLVDTDRALKNELNDSLKQFFKDQRRQMNDKQQIKSIFILNKAFDYKSLKEKDAIMTALMINITHGKFEFKKGNTLAAFAEAMDLNMRGLFSDLPKPQYQLMTGEDVYHPNTDYINYSSLGSNSENYFKLLKACSKLIPFYQYYFDFYLPSKKAVVMALFSKVRIYDEQLYSNFTKTLEHIIANTTDNETIFLDSKQQQQMKLSIKNAEQGNLGNLVNSQLFQNLQKNIKTMSITQNPINNEEIDRFYDIFEVLEFHAQEQMLKKGKNITGIPETHNMSQESLEKLLVLLLNRIKQDRYFTLLQDTQPQCYRFNLKLKYLLNPHQKKIYYNSIVQNILEEAQDKKNVSPFAILSILKSQVEQEYLTRQNLISVLSLAQKLLIEQYDTHYESLIIKESMFMSMQMVGTQAYDENEYLVDEIIKYREAFEMFIQQVTGNNQELMVEAGGLLPEFYHIYAKMFTLNQVVEKFLNQLVQEPEAAETELNKELSKDYFEQVSNDMDSLTFFPFQKKQWFLSRNLLNHTFIDGAPQQLKHQLLNLRNINYDPVQPLVKLRNQFFITYKTFLRHNAQAEHSYIINNQSYYDQFRDQLREMPIPMDKGNSLMVEDDQALQQSEKNQQDLLIEELFKEDQDLKMKLATQYDMLSFVGSDIDEIKMDHLTFFKIFNRLWGGVSDNNAYNNKETFELIEYEKVLETDPAVQSLFKNLDFNDENHTILNMKLPYQHKNQLKSLAHFKLLSQDLDALVSECLLQLQNNLTDGDGSQLLTLSPHLISKILQDVFSCLQNKHLFALLISSDIELYQKLQKLDFILKNHDNPTVVKKIKGKTGKKLVQSGFDEKKSYIVTPIDVRDSVLKDDQGKYDKEIFGNFNKYYFSKYVDETIPYREEAQQQLQEKRQVLEQNVNSLNKIYQDIVEQLDQPGNKTLRQNHLSKEEQPAVDIGLTPFFTYIDQFSNMILNSYSSSQINQIITNLGVDGGATVVTGNDKYLNDLLQHDYTDLDQLDPVTEQPPQSILVDMELKNYDTNAKQLLKQFNTMVLKSGLMRSFLEKTDQSNAQSITSDKRLDLIKTIVEKKGAQTFSANISAININTPAQVLNDLVIFPHCMDYHVEIAGKNEIIKLEPSLLRDPVDSVLREAKVKHQFGKFTAYQEVDFSKIKLEHIV